MKRQGRVVVQEVKEAHAYRMDWDKLYPNDSLFTRKKQEARSGLKRCDLVMKSVKIRSGINVVRFCREHEARLREEPENGLENTV